MIGSKKVVQEIDKLDVMDEQECVNLRKAKDMPDRASAYLFNKYLLSPYYVSSTLVGMEGITGTSENMPPWKSFPTPCRSLLSV